MSDVPDRPGGPDEDPFGNLPPEVRAMLEQFGGPDALARAQEQMAAMFAGAGPGFGFQPPTVPTGPVDWDLAMRVALQLAADGDRSPTEAERRRAEEAFNLAEHWLDATPLPAPPDTGRTVVGSRQEWVNAALTALRPFVEPVARASTDGLIKLAQEQFEELKERGELLGEEGLGAASGLPQELLDNLPPGLEGMIEQLLGQDPAIMLRPAGAALAGLQAGQVIGQLSHQLIGQYDLGIPTAPREQAHHLTVNVAADLEGYGVDLTEVAIVLALTEAAHRRLYHAVPWLEAHIHGLVARFAAGTTVDVRRLQELSEELMTGVDPDDPDSLRRAMEQAAGLRLEPTPDQRRVLERLQGVVCLVGAWARHEVDRAVEGRLPSLGRIQEVLRRRRASRGDGEQLLEGLLGLDLKPDDETVGEAFVLAVEGALGPAGLHRALAHPENLPDAEELADPGRWLERTADDGTIPDDVSALFGDLGEAPVEGSAAERREAREGEDRRPDDGDADPQDG